MKSWHFLLIGLFLGLIFGGIILLIALPDRGKPIDIYQFPNVPSNTETIQKITIHINGEVVNPGIYQLPVGSRLVDAINAAGGLTNKTNADLLNLAQLLEDGTKHFIPGINLDSNDKSQELFQENNKKININTANIDELTSLPGIGEVKAQAIIEYRENSGYFTNIESIMDVPGIGENLFSSIQNLITIGQ
jgi:competence protein ComEA